MKWIVKLEGGHNYIYSMIYCSSTGKVETRNFILTVEQRIDLEDYMLVYEGEERECTCGNPSCFAFHPISIISWYDEMEVPLKKGICYWIERDINPRLN